jgi:hypothetical protein
MDKYTIPLEKAVELTPIPSEPVHLFLLGYGHWGMNTLERIPTKRIVE